MNYIHLIKKYRILHILFWVWRFAELYHEWTQYEPLQDVLPDVLIILSSEMFYVYFSVYYLIPKYINKEKYLAFGLLSVVALLGASTFSTIVQEVYLFATKGQLIRNFLFITFTQAIDIALKTTIFVAVVLISERYNSTQLKKKLEKEKLETELRFLKSQINPHFLFNALNCIYVLISIDKDVAASTLLQFSDLLRYQLYECSDSTVEIMKEFTFLNDYINLEKIRKPDNLKLSTELEVKSSFKIAPFILIPFIENAFKHVSHDKDRQNFITIRGKADDGSLHLFVSNTCNKNKSVANAAGIGLQNVIRRLELLYAEKHALDIVEEDGVYTINLTLYAEENELHHS